MSLYQSKSIDSDTLLSATITWLRFPLMVAVVFIHMNPDVDMQLIDYDNLKWIDFYYVIGTLGSNIISHIAVPCFFMFSGFLFFYKIKDWSNSTYLNKLKKRIKTLLIPYIIWNLIPIIIYGLMSILSSDTTLSTYLISLTDSGIFKIFWNSNEWGTDRVNVLGWYIPNTGPYNFPLWFLRDLIVIIILSPIVYYFMKYTKVYGILLLGIAFYTKVWFLIPGLSIMGLFFFSLGAYFSIHKKNFITEFNNNRIIWLAIAAFFMIFSTYFDNTDYKILFFPVFKIAGVISVIILVSQLLKKEKIQINVKLSNTSFFIYVTHAILILNYSIKLTDYIFPSEHALVATLKYVAAPILTTSVCILVHFLMKKLMPRFLGILLGDR